MLESPIRKLFVVSPQCDFGWDMNQLKVTGLALPSFASVCFIESHVEESIVPARVVVLRPCSEFFIGSHQGGSDVVCHENGLGVDVQKLNDVLVSDDTATTGFGEGLGRNDLPLIICVFVAVTSDLLTC